MDPSVEVKVGIAVGIGVALVSLLLMMFYLKCRRARLQEQAASCVSEHSRGMNEQKDTVAGPATPSPSTMWTTTQVNHPQTPSSLEEAKIESFTPLPQNPDSGAKLYRQSPQVNTCSLPAAAWASSPSTTAQLSVVSNTALGTFSTSTQRSSQSITPLVPNPLLSDGPEYFVGRHDEQRHDPALPSPSDNISVA